MNTEMKYRPTIINIKGALTSTGMDIITQEVQNKGIEAAGSIDGNTTEIKFYHPSRTEDNSAELIQKMKDSGFVIV